MTTATPITTPGKLVGQRIKRSEDPNLLLGRGNFTDDIKLPGMLHLAFVRGDMAHGKINGIDTSEAKGMPGVVAVYTGDDLKAVMTPMPVITPFPAPDHYPVTHDKVRYVGDPVAVVVATDRYLARDAADAIVVDITELPAVVDPEQAMTDPPALVHDEFPNNVAVTRRGGTDVNPLTQEYDDTKVDAAFANAEIVVSQRMESQRLAPMCMEPRGVVAHFETAKGDLTVWTSTQTPHWVRQHLASGLTLGEHKIRVIAPDVGGGFGAKKIYGEDYVAAAISIMLGVPIKWIEDRSESFMTTTHGRGQIGYVDIAASKAGKIEAVRVRIVADIGGYEMLATAFVPTLTMTLLSSLYDIPVIRAELSEAFTNKMPTDAYRGAGRPEGVYYVERTLDILARRLNMNPADLRRRNFIQPDQFPFVTQAGAIYDSGEYERMLDKLLEVSNWEQLIKDRDAARAEGRLVGVGLGCYVEICGLGPSSQMPTGGWEYGSVTVQRDGKVIATTGSSAHGQGHETTFAQLLSDELGGVPMSDISILHGDTAVSRQGIGTFGSRSQAVGGTVLMKVAGKIRDKMSRFAGVMLETQPEDIVFENGMIGPKDHPESALPFRDVASYAYIPTQLPRDTDPGLSEDGFWEPERTNFPFGGYVLQVEVDRDTGEIALQKLIGVDDAGVIVNPLIVDGQIHGGLAQGIGQSWMEGIVYDEDGQLLTGSLMDYSIPRASDFPNFDLHETVTPTPLNPLGAKGVGEAGTIGSSPAFTNAVVDALYPLGIEHIEMPTHQNRVWELIQKAGG